MAGREVVVTTATKAIVAAIGAALSAGIPLLVAALSDNVITTGEAWGIIVAVVAGSGLTGGATYQAVNKPKPTV
jgi:hypothetical protein